MFIRTGRINRIEWAQHAPGVIGLDGKKTAQPEAWIEARAQAAFPAEIGIFVRLLAVATIAIAIAVLVRMAA